MPLAKLFKLSSTMSLPLYPTTQYLSRVVNDLQVEPPEAKNYLFFFCYFSIKCLVSAVREYTEFFWKVLGVFLRQMTG